MNAAAIFSRRWITTTLLVVAGGAVCVRLGIWQLDRLAQRQAFSEHVNATRALPALGLPSGEALAAQEYRSVQARGAYDYEHQVALRNQAYEGQYGFHLLTPLLLEEGSDQNHDEAIAVLVDRGWIPASGNEYPGDWRKYDAAAPIEVQGVIRLGQETPALGGLTQRPSVAGQEEADFWLHVNVSVMSRQLPYAILPVYIQLDGHQNSPNLPIAAPPALDLSEGPHWGYAMQWFGFTLILVIGYPIYVSKQESKTA
ncbi:MAG: SURF1 family protein [Chloroflexota bacterium]